MGGTCKGYIQQVEVIYNILQMFVEVVVLIDGASHLTAAEVDRCDGQCVERCFVGFAPQNVGHFQAPVAEGNEDMRELQTLTLVDG